MSTRSTAIARGVVIQVLAKFSALPLSMVTLGIATRYLGESGYGIMAAAVVFAQTFEAFTELGVGTIIVRRVAGFGGNLERLVGMNISFSTLYAVPLAVIAAIAGIGVYWGDYQQQAAVCVLAVGLIFTTVSSCYEPVFDIKVRYSSAASAEFFSRVLTLSAAASVAFFDWGLLAMCAVQIIPQALRLVIQWWGARRLTEIRWVVDWAEMWHLLKEAFPLTVIAIIAVLYWRADGLILSILGTPEQVGGYYAALSIAFTLTLISQVFERSVLSTINETYHSDRDRFARAVDQGYRFLLLVGFPIAVIGWPLAHRMADLVGGSNGVGAFAGPPLQFFFIAVAMTFLSAIVSDGLIAAHEQKYLTTMSTINLIINIVGNIILVPRLGAVACGIMLIVTETIGVLMSQWRLRRHGVHPLPFGYLARLVPAGLLALGAIYLTYDLPLLVPMAAGGIAYFGGALLVGAIPLSMRNALLGALRPKSLDRMEAEAAAENADDGIGVAPSAPTVEPRIDPAGVGLDAATTVLPGMTRVPEGRSALDAETAQMRPTVAAGTRSAPRRDLADITDVPTMELDMAALQTIRMRQQGKFVEMRVIRKG
ncbi:flippase [Actinomycetospora chiangmaiensis]|uniref:flippase n=1 Tax=Actinomycetospora chiangmaiensis TaxID=402650 RepID=UPI0003707200|nr:flippase [Actinomycetospora chiangmaiensis]